MKPDRRGSWYLLTGAVLGVAMGLVYSWLISPVKYVDAPPYALRADFKDDYRALIAAAYLYSNDLVRAEARLVKLKDDDIAQTIAIQAQRAIVEEHPEEEVRALGILATALGGGAVPEGISITPTLFMTSFPAANDLNPTPLIIEPTTSPSLTLPVSTTMVNVFLRISTSTPQPTRTSTPSPTPGAPFVLQETQMVCNVHQAVPLVQVEMKDAAGQPVPGVEIFVNWQGGADHFYTGLQPEMGLGYGDFSMTPGIVYSLHLADGGQSVDDLAAPECVAEDGSQYWGSWYLVFVQP